MGRREGKTLKDWNSSLRGNVLAHKRKDFKWDFPIHTNIYLVHIGKRTSKINKQKATNKQEKKKRGGWKRKLRYLDSRFLWGFVWSTGLKALSANKQSIKSTSEWLLFYTPSPPPSAFPCRSLQRSSTPSFLTAKHQYPQLEGRIRAELLY